MMRGLRILTAALLLALLCGCGGGKPAPAPAAPAVPTETERPSAALTWSEMTPESSLELLYAREFSVDRYEGGYSLISVGDGNRYLVVPEGAETPAGLDTDVAVLQQPLDRIYLVATSAMDLYRALDGISCIRLSGVNENGWYIPEARDAMARGELIYAGKYSAPDYERIYNEGCDLAVESTMIYHNPEVKERLESLGIPVLVERSSYETDPLGRMEWLKLHAVLLGKEAEAEAYFQELQTSLEACLNQENTGKKVGFFSINANGTVTVHKSTDYIAKSVELAGGKYAFPDLGIDESALSTVNMQMEAFYDGAKDADYLIYNSAITGELETMEGLLGRSALLKNFKAVQDGNVWCTGQNLFQESMGLGDLILDIHTVLTEDDPPDDALTYLHRLT